MPQLYQTDLTFFCSDYHLVTRVKRTPIYRSEMGLSVMTNYSMHYSARRYYSCGCAWFCPIMIISTTRHPPMFCWYYYMRAKISCNQLLRWSLSVIFTLYKCPCTHTIYSISQLISLWLPSIILMILWSWVIEYRIFMRNKSSEWLD